MDDNVIKPSNESVSVHLIERNKKRKKNTKKFNFCFSFKVFIFILIPVLLIGSTVLLYVKKFNRKSSASSSDFNIRYLLPVITTKEEFKEFFSDNNSGEFITNLNQLKGKDIMLIYPVIDNNWNYFDLDLPNEDKLTEFYSLFNWAKFKDLRKDLESCPVEDKAKDGSNDPIIEETQEGNVSDLPALNGRILFNFDFNAFAHAIDFSLDMIPVVGQIKGVTEMLTGHKIFTGEKLTLEETLLAALILIPYTGVMLKVAMKCRKQLIQNTNKFVHDFVITKQNEEFVKTLKTAAQKEGVLTKNEGLLKAMGKEQNAFENLKKFEDSIQTKLKNVDIKGKNNIEAFKKSQIEELDNYIKELKSKGVRFFRRRKLIKEKKIQQKIELESMENRQKIEGEMEKMKIIQEHSEQTEILKGLTEQEKKKIWDEYYQLYG